MRLVDTSAWIELLRDTPAGKAVRQAVPTPGEWLVPTIVQLEFFKWLLRELGQDAADEALVFSRTCVVVPLSTNLAVAAAEACREFKLSTADAIIYATAQAYGADLLTCDAHFKDLAGVVYLAKA
ncbi:MAG: type II toxin-antitoxin system VapC family toxin [Alphaproteobacteria bacterium]|nr:type II toxin-antitoxin system VapC family toxin [Alphaproteobacteria bacterium]